MILRKLNTLFLLCELYVLWNVNFLDMNTHVCFKQVILWWWFNQTGFIRYHLCIPGRMTQPLCTSPLDYKCPQCMQCAYNAVLPVHVSDKFVQVLLLGGCWRLLFPDYQIRDIIFLLKYFTALQENMCTPGIYRSPPTLRPSHQVYRKLYCMYEEKK